MPYQTAELSGRDTRSKRINEHVGPSGQVHARDNGNAIELSASSSKRTSHQYHSFDDVTLQPNQYFLSDAVQFRIANKQFIEQMNLNTAFRDKMLKKSPELLEWMKNSAKHSNSPPGFTWHHDETSGVLKLVHRVDHSVNSSIYHPTGKGGRDIWGGGKPGRTGKLNPDRTVKE